MNNIIELVDICKDYNGAEALRNINLSVARNEFLTLLGPSGCGKTTTLRIIGGFEQASSGKIMFDGADISDMPPYKRKVNTVFQRYALFPHLNVFENIAFGLRIRKLDEKEIKARVDGMLEMVNLTGYGKRAASTLSGGEQQRVAIARALVNQPEVLLLDEPLGALDLKLRKEMQIELKNMQKMTGITFIYVTHDQEEALTMSDTVIVMRDGRIQQTGTPIGIYNEPINAFVADFIGESNIIPGIMKKDKLVHFANMDFHCVDKGFAHDEEIEAVIRPEDITILPYEEGMLNGIVRTVTFKGVHFEMIIDVNGRSWMVHSTEMEPIGSCVRLKIGPNDIHIMRKGREN